MSLMLKLLAIILVVSSILEANSAIKKIENFLDKNFKNNPNIESIKVNVTNEIPVPSRDGWMAYYVNLDAVLKKDKRKVSQKMLWFSNGKVLTKELYDLSTGADIKDLVSLPFKEEFYHDSNLIYGNKNARNKVAIFSDPLCPFCRNFVPKAIDYMKNDPKKFAVYYFHYPLESLHPAAVVLVRAAAALELQGRKNVILDLYKVEVNPRENSVSTILSAFNKAMNSNISESDIISPAVMNHISRDEKIANELMVQGTPTMFFNGKLDKSKAKYKAAK